MLIPERLLPYTKKLKNMQTRIVSSLAILILFIACSSSEIGNSKDVNPATIFTQYSVTYTEGDENANCFAQFRFAGEKGTTLVLNEPAALQFDGGPLHLDSSDLSGAYYLKDYPFAGFAGAHQFKFTNLDGTVYEEDFEFIPFAIAEKISEPVSKKKPLSIRIEGLKDGAVLHISISDTAFATSDIDHAVTLENGKLVIQPEELQLLSNGPITLSIQKIDTYPLHQSTSEGGNFEMIYSLKTRDTFLKD